MILSLAILMAQVPLHRAVLLEGECADPRFQDCIRVIVPNDSNACYTTPLLYQHLRDTAMPETAPNYIVFICTGVYVVKPFPRAHR